jgi:hypothetical protein
MSKTKIFHLYFPSKFPINLKIILYILPNVIIMALQPFVGQWPFIPVS